MTMKKSDRKDRYREIAQKMLNKKFKDAFDLLGRMMADDVGVFILTENPFSNGEWQPIGVAPKEVDLLLRTTVPSEYGQTVFVGSVLPNGKLYIRGAYHAQAEGVTHWMPLPQPPEEEK